VRIDPQRPHPDATAEPRRLSPQDCLAGGGEMGALMRSTDWRQTVFGPVAEWPQSLRTAISIMLESRFAMVVAWGPEFRFFYNDRYRPVLGTKHPASLGAPGAEIFPEIWSVVGPEFERVRRGEAFAIDDWLLPLPIITLSLASATGPAIGQLAILRVESTAGRVAKAQMLEPYAVPSTDAMSAQQAGAVLHSLARTGALPIRNPLEREPITRYDPWPRESKPVTMPNLEAFGTQLIPRAATLTAEETAYLERVVQYPALADLSRVARARAADVTGGRLDVELLAGISVVDLPFARFSGLRDATQFHTAKAVLDLSRGEAEAAETTLREVIAVGLLVMRESQSLIDVLVGASITANGGAALQSLYRTTGRHDEADAMLRPQEGIERMENITRALHSPGDVDAMLRRSMAMTTDEALPRGMRWEALMSIQIGVGCLNPHTVVFGNGEEYATWLAATRASLVRYPSEEALFDVLQRGPTMPAHLAQRATVLQRLLGITLGRSDTTRTCAALMAGITAD
jgi:hypothetical protein